MGDVRFAMGDVEGAPSNIAHRTSSIPYRRLGASALFAAYAEGDARALAYFAHDPWDATARAEAARHAAEHPRDRGALADALLDQNAAWWGEEEAAVRDGIARLRDPASVAVVTGQQLGLFGGPLYTVHKALTAVRLARRIEAETGRPAVPVFWLADEDHDFAEVHATSLLNRYEVTRVAYEDGLSHDANRGPVGRIALDAEAIERALAAAAGALPKTPFAADLLDGLRADWRPGARWRDAFARTLRRQTAGAGLVFASSDDARLKRLAAPLFSREIEAWPETLEALEAASDRLRADGFHAQVAPRPVNLFLFHEGQRTPVDPQPAPAKAGGEGFVLRGTGVRFSKGELLALAGAEPERFSPGVVLRPVMQDRLFPTAAYVGGPGEVAYFAQLGPVYDAFGVPMPVVYPRASLTLVPEKPVRILDRYGLDLPDLQGDLSELHRRLALERSDTDLDAAFAEAASALGARLDALKPVATGVDTSLDRAVEAARAKARNALDALQEKTVRAEKRNQGVILDRLARAAAVLFPGGKPQDRVLSPLSFLATEGPGFPGRLLESLDTDTRRHQVLRIP